MGNGLAAGMGVAVGVIDRLARQVMAEPVALEPAAIAARVAALLPSEAPLLPTTATAAVVDALVGLGPIEVLLRDPQVSDVLVNGNGDVWVERAGTLQRSEVRFANPADLVAAVERVIAPLGLQLDRASPAVDARLADGSRLHAIVPPAAVDGPVLAVRRFTEAVADLAQLVDVGWITKAGAGQLRSLVTGRQNIVVCLKLRGHVVRLEGRPPNSEGRGAITLRQLLRHALRLRPDRIIVGEVRGVEAFDMLQAMSTGHDGSMSTIHASSAAEALWRLETLALSSDVPISEESIRRQVRSAVDAVVVVGRHEGRRLVRGITLVADDLDEVYECS